MQASEADLATTDGVGPTIAAAIVRWFAVPANRDFVDKLERAGVEFGLVEVSRLSQHLAGKAVVVTGALDGYTRESAEAAIKDRGGKSPGSVSAKTFALVVGADPGASKLAKAHDLGVPILDLAGFEQGQVRLADEQLDLLAEPVALGDHRRRLGERPAVEGDHQVAFFGDRDEFGRGQRFIVVIEETQQGGTASRNRRRPPRSAGDMRQPAGRGTG
jgi:hypothetical protein